MSGRRGAAWLLVVPPLAWLVLFFLVPLALIAAYSLRAGSGVIAPDEPWILSLEQFGEVLGTPAFVRLLGISVLVALSVATLATVAAYPIAYFLCFRAGSRARRVAGSTAFLGWSWGGSGAAGFTSAAGGSGFGAGGGEKSNSNT